MIRDAPTLAADAAVRVASDLSRFRIRNASGSVPSRFRIRVASDPSRFWIHPSRFAPLTRKGFAQQRSSPGRRGSRRCRQGPGSARRPCSRPRSLPPA